MKTMYGYILASKTRRVYTGITSDLHGRVWQHKVCWYPNAFTSRYNINKLVYMVEFNDPDDAIAWEKRVKDWTRAKRVALIEQHNPRWNDLAWDWYGDVEQEKVGVQNARRTGLW